MEARCLVQVFGRERNEERVTGARFSELLDEEDIREIFPSIHQLKRTYLIFTTSFKDKLLALIPLGQPLPPKRGSHSLAAE